MRGRTAWAGSRSTAPRPCLPRLRLPSDTEEPALARVGCGHNSCAHDAAILARPTRLVKHCRPLLRASHCPVCTPGTQRWVGSRRRGCALACTGLRPWAPTNRYRRSPPFRPCGQDTVWPLPRLARVVRGRCDSGNGEYWRHEHRCCCSCCRGRCCCGSWNGSCSHCCSTSPRAGQRRHRSTVPLLPGVRQNP